MFCPRCGQQAAEEVRFCSRCGLPLDAAAEIVATGGRPVTRAEPDDAGGALTPRQRGTRKGLMVAAGGAIFFVIVALLLAVRDELFPFLILAALILTAGVMRMLYALLLEEHGPGAKTRKPDAVKASDSVQELGGGRAAELPPARAVPVSFYANTSADTSDMAASPLSVTEGTTRLLDEVEEGGKR
ncbi:MAG: zinc ribbon domain-containing protein [Pyrinomonadaceae bacterium]